MAAQGQGCTRTYLTTTSPAEAFRLFRPTGIAPREVSVKEGDLLFSLTTAGVMLITLTSRNRYVAWMLNCWLLGSGNIICPDSSHTPLPFPLLSPFCFLTFIITRNNCKETISPWRCSILILILILKNSIDIAIGPLFS